MLKRIMECLPEGIEDPMLNRTMERSPHRVEDIYFCRTVEGFIKRRAVPRWVTNAVIARPSTGVRAKPREVVLAKRVDGSVLRQHEW